jgi:hypothetical protein
MPDGLTRASRFGYHLADDEEQRHKAIRDSVIADTNSHGVVSLKRTREMIESMLLYIKNGIYLETGPHLGGYPNPEFYELFKPWEERANRDFIYLNEWGRDYKVQKDAEAGRVYLIRPEDIHLPPDYGLTLTRIFSQYDKPSLKRDLSENGPLRRKLEQSRHKQKV